MLAVVTGATGFVGRAVCARLLKSGWRVRGLARTLRPQPPQGIELRLLDLEREDPATALEGADVVFHLAGRAHILEDTSKDPGAAFQSANSEATAQLAHAAVKAGVSSFLFASTAKVHGEESPGRPFTERDAPAPQDPYSHSKWDAEQRLRGILPHSTILRPPLVYGPGVGANFLRLMKLVERGIPLPLASVNNRRSMIFVGNLADCFVSCATLPAASGRTFLVSDGEDVSTPQLLQRLGTHMNTPANLWPCPPSLLRFGATVLGKRPEADRLLGSLQLDSSAVLGVGWRRPYSLEEGLEQTVLWYRGKSPPTQ